MQQRLEGVIQQKNRREKSKTRPCWFLRVLSEAFGTSGLIELTEVKFATEERIVIRFRIAMTNYEWKNKAEITGFWSKQQGSQQNQY